MSISVFLLLQPNWLFAAVSPRRASPRVSGIFPRKCWVLDVSDRVWFYTSSGHLNLGPCACVASVFAHQAVSPAHVLNGSVALFILPKLHTSNMLGCMKIILQFLGNNREILPWNHYEKSRIKNSLGEMVTILQLKIAVKARYQRGTELVDHQGEVI